MERVKQSDPSWHLNKPRDRASKDAMHDAVRVSRVYAIIAAGIDVTTRVLQGNASCVLPASQARS